MEKRGLVLEGGGLRGMFTCGVLDVLMENNIDFDGAVGISAGAVFGCNFKSKQIGRAIRYNMNYCQDWRYASYRSLLTTGDIFGEKFCYETIPNELDPFDRETFKKNPMEFYVGAIDVESGKILYHNCTDGGPRDLKWMQASASMPLAARFVEVDGRKMLDGGIVNSIPLQFMEGNGYRKNLVILTQPKGFVKGPMEFAELSRLKYRHYPKLLEAMETRHIRYNKEVTYVLEKEEKGEILVIRPPEALGISRVEKDPDELKRVYDLGKAMTIDRISEIRTYLEK